MLFVFMKSLPYYITVYYNPFFHLDYYAANYVQKLCNVISFVFIGLIYMYLLIRNIKIKRKSLKKSNDS